MSAGRETMEGGKPYVSILFIGHQKLDEGWRYPNLAAPFWRFYWNDRPGAVLIQGKRRIAINPSHVYLIAPDTDCASFSPTDGPGHLYIHFLCQPPHALLHAPEVLAFPVGPESLAMAKAAATMVTAGNRDPHLTLRALSLVTAALCKIPQEKLAVPPQMDPRVTNSLEILASPFAYQSPPANDFLAASVGMSVNGFLRLFKRDMHTSPHAYLLRCRIREARILLRVSDFSIKEIAGKFGFHDRSHFSRLFKRECGTSPGKYRRNAMGR